MKILLATTSTHKAQEIAELLAPLRDLELSTLQDTGPVDAPEETGLTMAENALLKAKYYAGRYHATVLADDSGLEVDALDGLPGVHSARWLEGTDEERTRGVLERLQGVPPESRTARYRCALCLATPHAVLAQCEATCEGAIATQERGTNGFGYDPIFVITSQTKAPKEWLGATLGEASAAVKAGLSHRARAVQELLLLLQSSEA
jgi:XTP/dITP diphosphohydrolase